MSGFDHAKEGRQNTSGFSCCQHGRELLFHVSTSQNRGGLREFSEVIAIDPSVEPTFGIQSTPNRIPNLYQLWAKFHFKWSNAHHQIFVFRILFSCELAPTWTTFDPIINGIQTCGPYLTPIINQVQHMDPPFFQVHPSRNSEPTIKKV